jgi:RNA 2',3'-cyclic 3'-phosphodiesterase
MIRAFLALDLPDRVRAALAVQQFLLPLPRKVDPAHFHLTLAFLGEVPDATLETVHDGMQVLRLPVFDLVIHGIGHFGGAKPRAVYAGAQAGPALVHLHGKVETVARRAGCDIPHTRFVPHVTLGRFATPAAADLPTLERAIVAGSGFRLEPFPVQEVVLYRSIQGTRPRYEALAHYPLVGSTVVNER